MADSVTTGSILQGLKKGLSDGVCPSGTFMELMPTLTICTFDPNNYLTHLGGSTGIAWACSTGSYFMSKGNVGGSTWIALKST